MQRVNRDNYEVKQKLLSHHVRGLSYTATGYGDKIPTAEMIKINNRWYRIYCRIFSNSGVNYIISKGQEIIISN